MRYPMFSGGEKNLSFYFFVSPTLQTIDSIVWVFIINVQ